MYWVKTGWTGRQDGCDSVSFCVESRVVIRLRMAEPCSTAHFRSCAVMCCFFKAKSLRAQIRSPLCIFAVVSKEASATTSPGAVWLRPVAAHGKPWPQNGSVHGESSATKA